MHFQVVLAHAVRLVLDQPPERAELDDLLVLCQEATLGRRNMKIDSSARRFNLVPL